MPKNPKVTLKEAENFRCICATCIYSGIIEDNDRTLLDGNSRMVISCDKFGMLYLKQKRRWCGHSYIPHVDRLEREASSAVCWYGEYMQKQIKTLEAKLK